MLAQIKYIKGGGYIKTPKNYYSITLVELYVLLSASIL